MVCADTSIGVINLEYISGARDLKWQHSMLLLTTSFRLLIYCKTCRYATSIDSVLVAFVLMLELSLIVNLKPNIFLSL